MIKEVEVPGSVYSNILTDAQGDLLYCSVLKIYENYTKDLDCDFTMEIEELPGLIAIDSSYSEKNSRSSPVQPLSPMLSEKFTFYEPNSLLVPKGLVIISKQPLFHTFQKILMGLYKISQKKMSLPMECYITHMILQIPLPSRGQFTIRYLLESYGFSIFLPPCNKLPLLDLNLAVLFNSLDLDNLLVLFRNILLEKSIVFVSAEEQKLAYCTYAMITLIFPFH